MKLMQLSDLHLGKRLIEVSLLEDQAYILDRLAELAAAERPDAVLICGDIYDRSNPPVEAVALFGEFLRRLAALGCAVLVISGNHDSPERVAYLGALVRDSGVYLAPVYDGHAEKVTLRDAYGEVDFYLMPWVHPENARRFFPDEVIRDANDAARLVIGGMRPDPDKRNVILSHQCVLGSAFDAREQRAVGTLDSVDPALYDGFDYVALGHIHSAQAVGRSDGTMRYCGTPLKYSKKEAAGEKSATFVELGKKGDVRVWQVPIQPLREVRALRGSFDDLMARGPEAGTEADYFFITLTDEVDIPNAAARLRDRFGRVLALDFDNRRTREGSMPDLDEGAPEDKPPLQLLAELYRMTHGQDMSEEALAYVAGVMAEMEGFDA